MILFIIIMYVLTIFLNSYSVLKKLINLAKRRQDKQEIFVLLTLDPLTQEQLHPISIIIIIVITLF